jgi:hypothetical protein
MSVEGIPGLAVAATAGGALLIYSGIRGANVSATLRSVVSGQKPSGATTEPITASYQPATGTSSAAAGPAPVAGTYTTALLKALWISQGGSASTAANAACHAMQESSGRPGATSANPDGGVNVGLWQLDTRGVGAGYTVAQLKNPVTNARITVLATRNGTDWAQWATPGC